MATERTIQHTDGTTERVTTNDGPTVVETRRGGGGAGGVIALVIGLLAVLVIGYFLLNMSRSEQVESDAIAGAAESVSSAAENVGDAASRAVPAGN